MATWQAIIILAIIVYFVRIALQRREGIIFSDIERGNLDGIKKTILIRPNLINTINSWHGSPLHYALQLNKMNIVTFLLENGAQIDTRNRKGSSPLHIAAIRSKVEVLVALIQKGADVNVFDKDGNSPLYLAVVEGYMDKANALIEAGADLNSRNMRDQSPVMGAILTKNDSIAMLLFSKGASFTDSDSCKVKEEARNDKFYENLSSSYIETAIEMGRKLQIEEQIRRCPPSTPREGDGDDKKR